MIDDLDVLLSVAEISVAFAGFAGIITAVTGRTGGGWDPANLTRFRLMIYSSLSAVVTCLIPYVFLLNSEQVDWGWSIGLLGLFLLAFSGFWIRSFILARNNLNNYVSFGVSSIAIVGTIAQFGALAGFFHQDLGIYFIGVFCLFTQTCIAFIRLVQGAILKTVDTN